MNDQKKHTGNKLDKRQAGHTRNKHSEAEV